MSEPLTREQLEKMESPYLFGLQDDQVRFVGRLRGAALHYLAERDAERQRADAAERALERKGYRKSCDIPACNCGDQWNHGGNADTRLSEIYDALGMLTQGKTALTVVNELLEAAARAEADARALRAALEELADSFATFDASDETNERVRAALTSTAGARAHRVIEAARACKPWDAGDGALQRLHAAVMALDRAGIEAHVRADEPTPGEHEETK